MLFAIVMQIHATTLLVAATLLGACGGGSNPGVADASVEASTDGGGPSACANDAACDLDARSVGTCHGSTGVIHRAGAATCASNVGADAGCNIQPHDDCVTDADCGAGKVCLCQTPPAAGEICPGGVGLPAGNACILANCRTDAECGPCGVCQADYACGGIAGYFCQTPSDPCFPDSSGYDGNGCRFKGGRWTSSGPPLCPG